MGQHYSSALEPANGCTFNTNMLNIIVQVHLEIACKNWIFNMTVFFYIV